MNILLGDFNANFGREDIFKPTIGSESESSKRFHIKKSICHEYNVPTSQN
jgi:hypothetical protein